MGSLRCAKHVHRRPACRSVLRSHACWLIFWCSWPQDPSGEHGSGSGEASVGLYVMALFGFMLVVCIKMLCACARNDTCASPVTLAPRYVVVHLGPRRTQTLT